MPQANIAPAGVGDAAKAQSAWAMARFLANDFAGIVQRLGSEPLLSAKARLVLAVSYRRVENNPPAIAHFEHLAQHQLAELMPENQLDVLDGLTASHLMAGNIQQASHYGTQAVKGREQVFTQPPVPWATQPIDAVLAPLRTATGALPQAASDGLKVLSYSLYGNLAVYIEMLIINLAACKVLYPDWQVWVYHDHTAPAAALARLVKGGAVLKPVSKAEAKYPGTMWRFFAFEDPAVLWVACRDADSFVTPRERRCVQAWLDSAQAVHAMRDWYTHSELLLAGMWGGFAPALREIRTAMDAFLGKAFTPSHGDQHFLRRYVWPQVRSSVCVHDSVFATSPRPFPDAAPPTLAAHVGNRLSSHFFVPCPPVPTSNGAQDLGQAQFGLYAGQGDSAVLICTYPLLRAVSLPVPGWQIEIPNLYRDAIASQQLQVRLSFEKKNLGISV